MKDNKELATNTDPVESSLPDEVTEILKDVKPETRKEIERVMISQFSMINRISPEAEVLKKVTGEHITTMLNTQDKAMEHTFQDNKEKRWFSMGIAVLACVVLVVVIVLLKDNPDMMEKIITIALTALLGGAGGYGIGFYKGKNDE